MNDIKCGVEIDLDSYTRKDLELIIEYCLKEDITIRKLFEVAIEDYIKFKEKNDAQLTFNFGDNN